MRGALATTHGAISLVNAIGTGHGVTMGTSLSTTVRMSIVPGKGITIHTRNQSSKMIALTIQNIVPSHELARNKVNVWVNSQVPIGCGLKSSSAVSTAVAMACTNVFDLDVTEKDLLGAGMDASLRSGVSITGAYDDVCGCYYGGVNLAHNYKALRFHYERISPDLKVIIFIPNNRTRKNVRNLKKMSHVLDAAWRLAKDGRYWDAMLVNGLAVSPILGPEPQLLDSLLNAGAMGASLSGNGPSIAAVAYEGEVRSIKKVFEPMPGHTIITAINNTKAYSHEL
ncbi:MAG: shikimate kinase [Cenarchaeum sp. SB0665_bin_23]|nr:shikimate kinase [Cenarchaeum sp. SB0665_bin_23]MYG33778.1 shikimate kinase [Cenarchaeum sp. SB0677_bin_16]